MKLSNLKVGVIGLLIFCALVVAGYMVNKKTTVINAEHFDGTQEIVPWETTTHRFVYTFSMIYKQGMRNQYQSLLFGAYDRFKAFTKEYFNTYAGIYRNNSHTLVSVPNRQVAIQFTVRKIDKITNQERVGRLRFSLNLDRLNDPNDAQFYDVLKRVLGDYVNTLM